MYRPVFELVDERPTGAFDTHSNLEPLRPKKCAPDQYAEREGIGDSLSQSRTKRIVPAQSAGTPSPPKEKPPVTGGFSFGGDGEIRTLEELLTPTRFPIVPNLSLVLVSRIVLDYLSST